MTDIVVTRVQAIRLMEAAQRRQAAEDHWKAVMQLVLESAGVSGSTVIEVDPYADPPRLKVQDG